MSVQNSVIVINRNSGKNLARMLAAMQMQEALTTEVIVVDCASTDGSIDVARTDFPTVRLIEMKSDRGFSAAANRGLHDALGEVVVVCHADIIAPSHNLVEMADRVRAGGSKRIAAAVPVLLDAGKQEMPFVGKLPGLASNTFGLLNPAAVRKVYLPSLDHVADHEWTLLPCAAFNTEILQKIGNFDERFTDYYGDTDICLRLHERGYRIAILRDVKVAHLGAHDDSSPEALKRMRQDHQRYIAKHRPAWERGMVSLYGMLRKNAG
jgi:GT2 family glycosyltransferase